MKLLIVSHTPHYRHHATIKGWGPTVREIDYLAEIFDEIVHIAPLHPGPVPPNALAYASKRIRLRPVKPAGGNSLQAENRHSGGGPSLRQGYFPRDADGRRGSRPMSCCHQPGSPFHAEIIP